MSAMGHKRTSASRSGMSAVLQKADMFSRSKQCPLSANSRPRDCANSLAELRILNGRRTSWPIRESPPRCGGRAPTRTINRVLSRDSLVRPAKRLTSARADWAKTSRTTRTLAKSASSRWTSSQTSGPTSSNSGSRRTRPGSVSPTKQGPSATPIPSRAAVRRSEAEFARKITRLVSIALVNHRIAG